MKFRKNLLLKLISMTLLLVILVIPNVRSVEVPPPDITNVLHAVGEFDKKNPVSTIWHELWPVYSRLYHLSSWEDTDENGELNPSDQIELEPIDPTGPVEWYHVGLVWGGLEFTWKEPAPPGFEATEPVYSDPEDFWCPTGNPTGTQWHMIYPSWSRRFEITSWEDTNNDVIVNPSDQFDITFIDDGTGPWWAHIDAYTDTIYITRKQRPVGGIWVPISKTELLTPHIGLVSVIATVAVSVVYVRLRKKRRTSRYTDR